MPQSAIAADIHQPFYVTGDLTAQIAFDPVIVLDYSRYPADFVLRQVTYPSMRADLRCFQDPYRCRSAYTIDISQSDLDPLVPWQVYTYYTSHRVSPPCLIILFYQP